MTVFNDEDVVASGRIFIQPTAPSIFPANSDGTGDAAAVLLRVDGDGMRTTQTIFSDGAVGSRAADPITFNSEDERLILVLFGTGIRAGLQLRVRVNGEEMPVLGFAASGEFVGLDQINVELLRSLIGAGEVEIQVIVDGVVANTVTVNMG